MGKNLGIYRFSVALCRLCLYRALPGCLCAIIWGIRGVVCGHRSGMCAGRNSEQTLFLGYSFSHLVIGCMGRSTTELCRAKKSEAFNGFPDSRQYSSGSEMVNRISG